MPTIPPELPRASPPSPVPGAAPSPQPDHLVYACRDLDRAVQAAEALLGVKAVAGGRHPGKGTRNALIGLGGLCYLEIVGTDPEQPDPPGPRWFQVDELDTPRLVTWCAAGSGLADLAERARSTGVELGPVAGGGRRRPDGRELTWEVTNPQAPREGGVIPFFIDWGSSPHPAAELPGECTLEALRVEHPSPSRIRDQATALGLAVEVEEGPEPRLVAWIRTPGGVVELR